MTAAPPVAPPLDMSPERTTSEITVTLVTPSLVELEMPRDVEISGPEARRAAAAVQTIAGRNRVGVMLNISGVIGVSPEARHAYSESIAARAVAIVGEGPVDRVIAHYLLRSRSESIPAQFFLSRPAALEWLRQYTE